MSEVRSRLIGLLFLPWLAFAIGGLSGWVSTSSMEGIITGCLIGALVSAISYFGFVPIVGVLFYQMFTKLIFNWVGVHYNALYIYGLVMSIIFTFTAIIIAIIMIYDREDRN